MNATVWALLAASFSWTFEKEWRAPEPVRGVAQVAGEWWTWGEALRAWNPVTGASRRLARIKTQASGCVIDVNQDGRPDLVAMTGQGLEWFEAPGFRARTIDAGALVSDCREATLLGHRGVLAIHRGMQVRLYEYVAGSWSYRELYSFYTASEQGGLLVRDIDGDTRPDIVCGNYWIRSPEEWELPWRLYAINLYHETENAATARMAFRGEDLVWLESQRAPGRVTLFRRPADPKVLWEAVRYGEANYPKAVVVMKDTVLIGENNGAESRLRTLEGEVIDTGRGVLALFESGGRLVGAGPRGFYFWRK
mgnify:CR=1 FL=1